jgi:mycothiol synthase
MSVARTFRWEDLPSLLGLMRRARRSDGDLRTLDESSLAEYLRDPGLEPERNCYLFHSGSELQAYLLLHHEPPLRRTVLEVAQHPEHRLDELQAELLTFGVAQGEAVGSRVAHMCLPHEDRSWDGAFQKVGLSLAHSYWLMRWEEPEPPRSPPPDGFSVRTLQPGEGHLLASVQNAAFSESWGFSPNTPEQAEYRAGMRSTGPGGVLLLQHGGDIAGYCWTLTEEQDEGPPIGTISMIGIHPDYRSRGLSKPILAAGLQHLCANGVDHVKLDVDSTNEPAIGLYTSMGFRKTLELHWFEVAL